MSIQDRIRLTSEYLIEYLKVYGKICVRPAIDKLINLTIN